MDSDHQEILEGAKELFNSSAEVMKQMDRNVLLELRKSGEAAVAKLHLLKESNDVESLLSNFREFGSELVRFLELGVARYQQTKWTSQRQAVVSHADCLRTILPNLMETVRETLRTKQDQHVQHIRDTFFSIAETSINGIVSSYKYLGPGESEDGEFLTKMDELFSLLDGEEEPGLDRLDALTQWVLRHSLAVAKGTNKEDEEEITRVCQKILHELNNYKKSARTRVDSLEQLGRSLELLEQNVNGALLRLAISSLTCLQQPLDSLIAAALRSDLEVKERISDDLREEVRLVDTQSDHLFQLCHFCLYCTTDQDKAQGLRSSGRLMEALEAELVPTVLQLYLSPASPGARAVARLVRQSWRSLMEQIQTLVLGIVDPTAYCVILLQELQGLARKVKTDLYSQDPRPLEESVGRLLSMAETGVDLAWRELGDKSVTPLPETHDLVKAERSIWEVRAACKLLVKTIQDLSLHQSLLKRVQVLVGAFQGLVTLLTDKAEETAGSVLFPSLLTAETPTATITRNSTNLLSFRAKRNLDKTALFAGELRKEMYKITVDLTPFTPRPEAVPKRPTLTRKPSKVTVNGCLLKTPIRRTQEGSRTVRRSSARLSSVISELSVLSHELSLCLEDQEDVNEDGKEDGKENSDNHAVDKLEGRHQNNSLRRVAFKNISNKVTLTSASHIAI